MLSSFSTINFSSEKCFSIDKVPESKDNLILEFDVLDSTNTFSKKQDSCLYNRSNTLILAKKQTAGYGRMGREWFSEPKNSLTFTLVKRIDSTLRPEIFPLLTALALAETFSHTLPSNIIDIKWPNDILLNNKKVAGILIENKVHSQFQNLFIGVGINLKKNVFPPEISKIACRLQDHSSENFTEKDILGLFLENFETLFLRLKNNESKQILNEYAKKSSYAKGKEISYIESGIQHTGITDGLDEIGALFCIDKNNHRKRLIISEVNSVRKDEL